jgi:hypothetical protein
MPTPRLLEKRKFKALATQRALIHDRKIAPNGTDKPTSGTVRKVHSGFADVIKSIQANPSPAEISG